LLENELSLLNGWVTLSCMSTVTFTHYESTL
jgi:hypothetical protein